MSVQHKAVEKALAILKAVDAKYKIILQDGTEIGDLEVVAKPKKRPLKYSYGSLTSYVMPYVNDAKIGEVFKVPFGEFDAESLRGVIASKCSQTWGNDTYATSINKEDGSVEVLRYL